MRQGNVADHGALPMRSLRFVAALAAAVAIAGPAVSAENTATKRTTFSPPDWLLTANVKLAPAQLPDGWQTPASTIAADDRFDKKWPPVPYFSYDPARVMAKD